jgi:cell wall-associated NlpC family hydrolase
MILVDAARAYLGVTFEHQGRNPAVGIDCAGLLVLAFADCGVTVPDRTDYGRDPYGGTLEAMADAALGARIGLDDLRPGDVVAIDYAGACRHVALLGDYLYGGLSLIHTDSMVGKVVEHRMDDKWRRRIVAAWRPIVGDVS